MPTIYCRDKNFGDIQAIIFDKDGTLEDSSLLLSDLANNVARWLEERIPGLKETILRSLGMHNNVLNPAGLMAVGSRLENEIALAAHVAQRGKGWLESRNLVQQAFKEVDLKEKKTVIFPGCYEVISNLHQRGLKLAILSSASSRDIEIFLEDHQLSQFIEIYQGADQGYLKPDPICFEMVCEKLQVSCANTLMVGDSQMDIQMASRANAAGIIAIRWGSGAIPCQSLAGADVQILNLNEIKLIPQNFNLN